MIGFLLGSYQREWSELKENLNSFGLINVSGWEGGVGPGGKKESVIPRFRVWVTGISAFLL